MGAAVWRKIHSALMMSVEVRTHLEWWHECSHQHGFPETRCNPSRMAENKWFGFWSDAAAARGYGSTVYTRPDGSKVSVTCVLEDPQGPTYKWKDKVALGEVVAKVSSGEPWDPRLIGDTELAGDERKAEP